MKSSDKKDSFLDKAILRTLQYADIFDYCLTAKEIHLYLIADKLYRPTSFSAVKSKLNQLEEEKRFLFTENDFYFLKGRRRLVVLRRQKQKENQRKQEIAAKTSRWFKLIPWIKMVGLTGSLAMENASPEDDLDLLIVTAEHRLWLTRFFLVCLTEILGARRKPSVSSILSSGIWQDKVCLNMFLDEDNLAIPAGERNLYTAHEVCQVKLLWDKEDTYKKFLEENRWVKKFLINFLEPKRLKNKDIRRKKQDIFDLFFNFLEKIAFKFQLYYMKPRKTIEKVEAGRVLFHPQDCSGWVMKKYNDRIRRSEDN